MPTTRDRQWLYISLLLPNTLLGFYVLLGYHMAGLRQGAVSGVRWASFSLLYWLPVGLLLNANGGTIRRWCVSYVASIPAFFACLWLVYPLSGSHFGPSSLQAWGVYGVGTLITFLAVAGVVLLSLRRGWISNLMLGMSAAFFFAGIIGPVLLERRTDRYRWPTSVDAAINLTNVQLVDVVNGSVIGGKNIHIEHGQVAQIVESATDRSDLPKLDAQGGFVLPGLIDVHAHLDTPVRAVLAQFDFGYLLDAEFSSMADHRRAYLESGVTTIRDLGGPALNTYNWRRAIADGTLLGPRLFAVGRLVTAPNGHPVSTIWAGFPHLSREGAILASSAASLRSGLEQNEAEGPADALKIVYGTIGRAPEKLSSALLEEALRWGRDHGKITIVHTETAEDIADAVRLGATGVEHSAMAGPLPTHLIESLAKAGTFVDPTFGEYLTAMTLDGMSESERTQKMAGSYAATRQMAATGVRLAIGTDAPLVAYGTGLLDELDHFVRAGFSPSQILTIATASNAAYLGQEGRLGCLYPNCAADLIVVHDNPLIDIRALRSVRLVLRAGVPVVRQTST